MEFRVRGGAGAGDVARVGGDLGMNEDDLHHGQGLKPKIEGYRDRFPAL
jgi:hypothetical protein